MGATLTVDNQGMALSRVSTTTGRFLSGEASRKGGHPLALFHRATTPSASQRVDSSRTCGCLANNPHGRALRCCALLISLEGCSSQGLHVPMRNDFVSFAVPPDPWPLQKTFIEHDLDCFHMWTPFHSILHTHHRRVCGTAPGRALSGCKQFRLGTSVKPQPEQN